MPQVEHDTSHLRTTRMGQIEFTHTHGQIVLYFWDWYVADNDPSIYSVVQLFATGGVLPPRLAETENCDPSHLCQLVQKLHQGRGRRVVESNFIPVIPFENTTWSWLFAAQSDLMAEMFQPFNESPFGCSA